MKTIKYFFSPILLFSLACTPLFTQAMQQQNNNNNNNSNNAQQKSLRQIFRKPLVELSAALMSDNNEEQPKEIKEAFLSVLEVREFPTVLVRAFDYLAGSHLLPEHIKSLFACHPKYLACIKFAEIARILKQDSNALTDEHIIAAINKEKLAELLGCRINELHLHFNVQAVAHVIKKSLQKRYVELTEQDIVNTTDSFVNLGNKLAFQVTLTYAFRFVRKVEPQINVQNLDLIVQALQYLDTAKAQEVFTKITSRQLVTEQEFRSIFKDSIQTLVQNRNWVNFTELTTLVNQLIDNGQLNSDQVKRAFNQQAIQRDLALFMLFGPLHTAPAAIATHINKFFQDELSNHKLKKLVTKAVVNQEPITVQDLQAIINPQWKQQAQEYNLASLINPQILVDLVNTLIRGETVTHDQIQQAFNFNQLEEKLVISPGTFMTLVNPRASVEDRQKALTTIKQLFSPSTTVKLAHASGWAAALATVFAYQSVCGDAESFCHGSFSSLAPAGFKAAALAGMLGAPALYAYNNLLKTPAILVNIKTAWLARKLNSLLVKQPAQAQAGTIQAGAGQQYDSSSDSDDDREPEQLLRHRTAHLQTQHQEHQHVQPSTEQRVTQPLAGPSNRAPRPSTSSAVPVVQQTAPAPQTILQAAPQARATVPVQPVIIEQNQQLDAEADEFWNTLHGAYQDLASSLTPEQRNTLHQDTAEQTRILSEAANNPALLIQHSGFIHALTVEQLDLLADAAGAQEVLSKLPQVSLATKRSWNSTIRQNRSIAQLIDKLGRATGQTHKNRLTNSLKLEFALYNPHILTAEQAFLAHLTPELGQLYQQSITR